MITKLTKEMIGTDSIRYHLSVSGRTNEGFGELKKYLGENEYLLSCLQMQRNEGIVNIRGVFPNGYCNYPNNPTPRDEMRMRRGLGSIMLAEMTRDAREVFLARVVVAFHPSDSFASFLRKKGFRKRGVLYYPVVSEDSQLASAEARIEEAGR